MTFIKIKETMYPATIDGRMIDRDWDNRESKSITLEMDYATTINLFVDGLAWSIVEQNEVPIYQKDAQGQIVLDENGASIQTGTEIKETEWDNSEFSVAGDITDHRNGTVTVKMGKPTDSELLTIIMGG